jgi:hypothetical protein
MKTLRSADQQIAKSVGRRGHRLRCGSSPTCSIEAAGKGQIGTSTGVAGLLLMASGIRGTSIASGKLGGMQTDFSLASSSGWHSERISKCELDRLGVVSGLLAHWHGEIDHDRTNRGAPLEGKTRGYSQLARTERARILKDVARVQEP